MSQGGTPPAHRERLVEDISELRDPILIYFFLKKVDALFLTTCIFLGFLWQRGPSIQRDLDKNSSIFDASWSYFW